jgi:hypothetical protein
VTPLASVFAAAYPGAVPARRNTMIRVPKILARLPRLNNNNNELAEGLGKERQFNTHLLGRKCKVESLSTTKVDEKRLEVPTNKQ